MTLMSRKVFCCPLSLGPVYLKERVIGGEAAAIGGRGRASPLLAAERAEENGDERAHSRWARKEIEVEGRASPLLQLRKEI